jgi:branched-chain amino acid transport system ATP-binding protein
MVESLLRVERVFKRFGGLLAVDDVSLIVEAGRITALIGPNGAGKTTLFSIISGFLPPSEGRVFHRGADITGMPPHLLARRGIVRTFQIVQPFAGLTVHQNIAIGAHLSRRSRAEALAAAAEVASTVGLSDVLDRPAASLTPGEVASMVPVIRTLADDGITIVMIEHVMQAVMSLAERVFVLAEGRIIAEGPPQVAVGDPRVVEAYLGRGAAARLSAAGAAHV